MARGKPEFRAAAIKAMVDIGDKRGGLASILRMLRRTGDAEQREAARFLVQYYKPNARGRPPINHRAVACRVHIVMSDLRNAGAANHGIKTAAYYTVASETGLAYRTVKEIYEQFSSSFKDAEEFLQKAEKWT